LAAPEGEEPGGGGATRAIRAMVDGRTLRCELDGERTHDRCVGICCLESQDIAAALVRAGVAHDCSAFSGGGYARLEVAAAADCADIREVCPLPACCQP
jgi:micrococcal nuclease